MSFWPFSEIAALKKVLGEEAHARVVAEDRLERAEKELGIERERRISAEALGAERRAEVERLVKMNEELRASQAKVLEERVRSLDALNVKLMTERAPEHMPNMEEMHKFAVPKERLQVVNQARNNMRLVDEAILKMMHPAFAHLKAKLPKPESAEGVVMNGATAE